MSIQLFFKAIAREHNQPPDHVVYKNNTAFLPSSKYAPFGELYDFHVNDVAKLDIQLEKYLKTCHDTPIGYTIPVARTKYADFALYNLVRNMAGSDYENVADYVRRRTDYITDTTFQTDEKTHLGEMNGFSLYSKCIQHLPGMETPFAMEYYFQHDNLVYPLPKVYYGISQEADTTTCCVYCVQNKRKSRSIIQTTLENPEDAQIFEELERGIDGIQKGLGHSNNTASHLALSLALFLKQIHDKGIRKVTAPDYIPARFDYRSDMNGKITDEDELDAIQSRMTQGFIRLFARLAEQINGLDITNHIGETDDYSYLHLTMGEELSTKNALLAHLCNIQHTNKATQVDKADSISHN